MKAYKREDLSNGTVVQIRKGTDSKAFTVHTDKSPTALRKIMLEFLNKLD